MRDLLDIYFENQSWAHIGMGLLIFGGLGRIAFWREHDGLRVGGPLAAGLALLLTIALLLWADENGRGIHEFGAFAAGLVVMAIAILGYRAFTKSGEL